jgi:hypothetical protein
MPTIELPFADGFYVSQSTPLLNKRVVNCYPVIPQADAVSKRALLRTPGIKELSDFGSGTSRGVLVFNDGVPYRVIGNTLISTTAAGAITSHGTITGTSDVSMASNGINIAIQVPDGNSYFFTPSTNTLELNNSSAFLSFGQATTVTFKDGFYFYTTDLIFASSSAKTVNDGKDFNALDFLDAEISPDRIVAGHNNHNQLYILGENTIEVYQNIATTGFPVQRIPGAMIQKGCSARFSVVDFDNSFLFVGGDVGEQPAIWKAIGSNAQKISTSSIDQLLQKSSNESIANIRAFTYSQNGDYFAVFEIGTHTFTYDATTSALSGKHEWHERQTGITNGNGFKVWSAVHGVKAFGKIIVASNSSGQIGELDQETLTEYGEKIERIFTTKPFVSLGDSMFSHQIELLMQAGVGDATTPDPQIRMDYSDDQGRTFTSEISKPMGAVGEYKTRVRWSRLGRIPNTRMLRFKMTDSVEFNIYSLFATAEGTSSG